VPADWALARSGVAAPISAATMMMRTSLRDLMGIPPGSMRRAPPLRPDRGRSTESATHNGATGAHALQYRSLAYTLVGKLRAQLYARQDPRNMKRTTYRRPLS